MKPLLFGLLLPLGLLSAATAQSLLPPTVFWPCNSTVQDVFDSNGESNRYTNDLPGAGWNDSSALAAAAANHHENIRCQNECAPSGCVKVVQWTSDSVTYVGGPGGASGSEFTYVIKNFKVTGFCTNCP